MNAPGLPLRSAEQLRTWIAPARTAFLVIDMQVDFASPDGALGKAGVDLTFAPSALLAASQLAHCARGAGVTVVFIGLETRAETDSPVWVERMLRRSGSAGDLALCRAGSPGAEFYGPAPAQGDLVVAKKRYSSFFGTRLDAMLRLRGIDTLVVSGMTTECCVDCTIRDAFHLDYHVFIAADACASYDKTVHEVAVLSLANNCAIAVQSADVMSAWTR